MSDFAALQPHLERRFENHQIVFWYDRQAQSAAYVENSDRGERGFL
jgi:hypothetical protein